MKFKFLRLPFNLFCLNLLSNLTDFVRSIFSVLCSLYFILPTGTRRSLHILDLKYSLKSKHYGLKPSPHALIFILCFFRFENSFSLLIFYKKLMKHRLTDTDLDIFRLMIGIFLIPSGFFILMSSFSLRSLSFVYLFRLTTLTCLLMLYLGVPIRFILESKLLTELVFVGALKGPDSLIFSAIPSKLWFIWEFLVKILILESFKGLTSWVLFLLILVLGIIVSQKVLIDLFLLIKFLYPNYFLINTE